MFADLAMQIKHIERGVLDIFPRDELIQKLERSRKTNRPLRIKLGIDPTSPDIHLGHAVPINKLRHFQELGHHIVLIIGDYTAMVGDPSGRDSTRPQLSHEQVLANARTYLEQVGKILDMKKVEVVHNGDWFSKMRFNDVVRLAARMTVARMLERDDFLNRYKAGEPISLHEFLYPLMQGYDSVMVRSDVEIGGNDQTFNLLVGRNLQKEEGMEAQVALTLPLLIGTDGTLKMSKSYGNHIGITETPQAMYGKAMSVPDTLMRNYFDLATDLSMEEVNTLLSGDPMPAKMSLAFAIVRRYHGEDAAKEAAERFDREVRRKELPQEIPEVRLTPDLLKDGRVWLARIIVHCGFARGTAEARRLIAQGGVTVDGVAITNADADIEMKKGVVLKVGKRNFARILT